MGDQVAPREPVADEVTAGEDAQAGEATPELADVAPAAPPHAGRALEAPALSLLEASEPPRAPARPFAVEGRAMLGVGIALSAAGAVGLLVSAGFTIFDAPPPDYLSIGGGVVLGVGIATLFVGIYLLVEHLERPRAELGRF